MSTRDNIIFYFILSVLTIGVPVLLYISEHVDADSSDKPLIKHTTSFQDDETRKEKNSVIDNITAIIIALAALIGIPFGIPTYLEKMGNYRIQKLKDRMLVLFSQGWDYQRVHTPETLEKFFDALGPKFQKKRYKDLHRTVFDELGREGRNPIWRHWDLKLQMVEEQMMQRARAGMPGPDGMIYRGGGRIIQKEDGDS